MTIFGTELLGQFCAKRCVACTAQILLKHNAVYKCVAASAFDALPCAGTGGECAWAPPLAGGGGSGDMGEEEEEEQLPDRRELVVSTFARLFPRSFAGVAAVHKHKVGATGRARAARAGGPNP